MIFLCVKGGGVPTKNITLTNKELLVLLLRKLNLANDEYTGRIEIHMTKGSIRNVLKIESVIIAD